MPTLKEIQDRTFADMCACLDAHHMCCVERPTGFGKTKLFMDYAARNPGGKFLYIYDMNSARDDIIKKYRPDNVEFLSYSAISREMSAQSVKQYICGQPWHSLIFDEAHLMGGENIQKLLLDILPFATAAGVNVLGGTATKMRTDLVDVSKRFFGGRGVEEYTILDAVNDGIMQEPIWAVTARYKALIARLQKFNHKNSYVMRQLSQLDKAYAHIDGVSDVYADTVRSVYGGVPDIMRFIVFYPTVKSLNDNRNKDVQDFAKAFPTHQVVSAALSTDKDHASTISEVEELFSNEGKQVQLIFAVNMLNQSYHSDLLTGIVMYRSTFSNIIFTQELGRILSVTAKYPGIVFDNVGNVFIRPDRAMAALQLLLNDQTKVPSSTSITRNHLNVKVRATLELIEFQKVYQRILATAQITQEQIDYAKYIVSQMNAPIELVMQGLRVDEALAKELVG